VRESGYASFPPPGTRGDGGDSVSGVPGLSWQGGECVDLRPGLGNSSYSNLPSGKGTFRCVWAPPPAGAVLWVR